MSIKPGISTTFAAAVVGLSTVERLTVSDNGVEASFLPFPAGKIFEYGVRCEPRTPYSLAVGDFNEDGLTDIYVHDSCGGYLVADVLGAAPIAIPASQWFPDNDSYRFVETSRTTASQTLQLVRGEVEYLQFLERSAEKAKWVPIGELPINTPWINSQITRVVVPVPDQRGSWIVQERAQLRKISIISDASVGLSSTPFKQTEVRRPSLVPYDAFDHLDVIGNGACGLVAVGVGLYDDVPNAPRHLVLLELSQSNADERTFTAREVVTDMEVITGAVARDDTSERAVIGVLGNRNGSGFFSAYELTVCGSLEKKAEIQVNTKMRKVSTPGFFDDYERPPTNGIRFATSSDRKVTDFIQYDGYDIRRFRVNTASDKWTIIEEILHVHNNRSDLSVPPSTF
jgi:hypothetical protein